MKTKKDTLEDLYNRLSELGGEGALNIAKQALFTSAGAVWKEYSRQVKALKTERTDYKRGNADNPRLLLPTEKKMIEEADLYIRKFRLNGFDLETEVGMMIKWQYAELKGYRVAVAAVAYACNAGTTFMVKQPFLRVAQRFAIREGARIMADVINVKLHEWGE